MVLKTNLPHRPAEAADPLDEIRSMATIEVGKEAAKHFAGADSYRNLNHGSFGTYPVEVRTAFRHYQELSEERPDIFIRYRYPGHYDKAREAVAKVVNADRDDCVFVPNATTAINTVLRNLVFKEGDIIIYFATIYGACEKTIEYITETTPAESERVPYTYPVSDDFFCTSFEDKVAEIRKSGRNPRIAIFDTIASHPGVRMPFECLTALCRKIGVQSCIDGAHSIGQIKIDLKELDPDYYFSNCHKWLYTPRGSAIFFVPKRNQDLMRSTLPTSHGFQPLPKANRPPINNPLPPSIKGHFVNNFEFSSTVDNSPYLALPAALEWRSKITWGEKQGEEAILGYLQHLSREAGKTVSKELGTKILENDTKTLGNCAFSNVALPLDWEKYGSDAGRIGGFITGLLINEFDTFIPVMIFGNHWWVRLSAQVYLTVEDFEWAAVVLKECCKRVEAGEYK